LEVLAKVKELSTLLTVINSPLFGNSP